uniref:Aminotransferase-like plant mobile domain-containing protein n=1 Tax=Fagus sylvatica TaxID=28930 RepID=A0A2N9HXF3_FAGSY
MFLLSTVPKQSHGGPMWLMQMWAYSYFLSISPELHPTIAPWSYGEAWMHARYPKEVPSYSTYFKLFSDPSRKRSFEEFMPFEAKKYGSKDFKEFSNQGVFRGSAAWGACLHLKDLMVIRNKDWSSRVSISKDEAKKVSILAKDRITSFTFTPFQVRSVSSPSFQNWWETYMAHFNNDDDLIEAIQGCCPSFLLHQLASAGMEHIASYVAPQPLQQISSSGKKISRGGIHTSTKRKTPEVEEVDFIVSTKDAKPSGKKLVKTVSKRTVAKKPKIIKAGHDASIEEAVPLVDDLDDATTLSILMKEVDQKRQIKAELVEAQQAKEEERRKAEKAEEERIVEIGRRLEVEKKEKAEAEKKKKEEVKRWKKEKEEEEKKKKEEVERKKKEKEEREEVEMKKKEKEDRKSATKDKAEKQKAQEVLEEKKRMVEADKERKRQEEEAKQQEIEAKALMEAVSSSIDYLDSTITSLQAAQDKKNQATSKKEDHEQRVSQLQAHQLNLQAKASELKTINQKVKSLEAELQIWKSKRSQKC